MVAQRWQIIHEREGGDHTRALSISSDRPPEGEERRSLLHPIERTYIGWHSDSPYLQVSFYSPDLLIAPDVSDEPVDCPTELIC